MKPTSICHIISGLGTGGAETQLLRLLQGGENAEFAHQIISLRSNGKIGDDLTALGYPVYQLNMQGWLQLPTAMYRLNKLLSAIKPDLIQGWMYHGNTMAALSSGLNRQHTPVVWNVRHSLHNLGYEKPSLRAVIRLNRYLSKSARAIVYNSVTARTQHERFGFCPHSATVIPNGFDLEEIRYDEANRDRIKKQLGIPKGVPVVGHIERFHPSKNHSGFLQAVRDILKHHPNGHFVMLGKDVVPENSELVRHMHHIPGAQLHLLGIRHDVSEILSAIDILCNTSSWGEGFANVLGEAMACSVPCVATDVGDSALVIADTGRVVERGDMTGLAREVNNLLDLPDAALASLKIAARQRMEAHFSIAGVRRQYASLYHQLLESAS